MKTGLSAIPDAVPRCVEDVLDVRDLRMRYGKTDVLNGVSFAARRGEVLALLGPNGAGKTTTIEILEGFRMRSSGQVSVLGTDPARGGEAWRARAGGRGRAHPHGRPHRAGRPAGPPPVRRAATPPGRGHRHRGPARAAVPRRADGRVRPRGQARIPR